MNRWMRPLDLVTDKQLREAYRKFSPEELRETLVAFDLDVFYNQRRADAIRAVRDEMRNVQEKTVEKR